MIDSRESAGENDRGGEDAPAKRLVLRRCGNSHAFFFAFESCPLCGGKLEIFESAPDAELVSHTVVRVSPTGCPFALGLARTENGAQTLCIIEDGVDKNPEKDVILAERGGLYYAARRPAAR